MHSRIESEIRDELGREDLFEIRVGGAFEDNHDVEANTGFVLVDDVPFDISPFVRELEVVDREGDSCPNIDEEWFVEQERPIEALEGDFAAGFVGCWSSWPLCCWFNFACIEVPGGRGRLSV